MQHLSIPLLSQRRDRFKEECERLGMEFIEVSAPDPMGPDGIPGTQRFILEDVPLQVQTRGKDIAVFGTNLSIFVDNPNKEQNVVSHFPDLVQSCGTHDHNDRLRRKRRRFRRRNRQVQNGEPSKTGNLREVTRTANP